MPNISLRLRITLLVGGILTLLTITSTVFSILSADRYFVEPQRNNATPLMSTEVVDHYPIFDEPSMDPANVDNLATEISVTKAQKKFSIQSILLSIVIIFFGIGLTYLIMGRALKPLTDLSKTIKDINEHTLNKLIVTNNSNDEIGSLSASFNKMIDRIKNSFTQQKYFAASAAHELKTPLATMKTALQVLELDDSPSNEDYQETMFVMKHSVDRMITTVNDLFLLSFDGKTDLNDRISLRCLFRQIAKELEESMLSKNLSYTLPEEDCLTTGNYMLIHSAFFNLFENAVKYNKEGGTITVNFQPLPNKKIAVSVTDTGIGMTKEEKEAAFDPFFRSENVVNQQIPGNGLGLSVIRTIVQKHGGQISLDSQLDKGTEVTVILND